jgi:hypothetical protein
LGFEEKYWSGIPGWMKYQTGTEKTVAGDEMESGGCMNWATITQASNKHRKDVTGRSWFSWRFPGEMEAKRKTVN